MKERQGLQIIEGFKKFSGRLRSQPLAQGSPYSWAQALSSLQGKQIESSLTSALQASEQRLNELLHDRRRIGRELHESVLQALYAIELSLEHIPRSHGAVPHSLDQVTGQLHTLIQDIRRMILSVESERVDPFRLDHELQALAQTVEQVSQVQVCVKVEPAAEEILTGEEARELVLIAREALSNSVRYARATRIVIALRRIGSRVSLRIRDNGVGFDFNHGSVKGIGFACMEDRVRKIGGRLEVQSTIGRGTSIVAHIYLEPILTQV